MMRDVLNKESKDLTRTDKVLLIALAKLTMIKGDMETRTVEVGEKEILDMIGVLGLYRFSNEELDALLKNIGKYFEVEDDE